MTVDLNQEEFNIILGALMLTNERLRRGPWAWLFKRAQPQLSDEVGALVRKLIQIHDNNLDKP
jgi:hypothetical protein